MVLYKPSREANLPPNLTLPVYTTIMVMISACVKFLGRTSVFCPNPGGARRATFLTSATLRTNENKRALHGVVRALQNGSQTRTCPIVSIDSTKCSLCMFSPASPTLLEKEFSLADKVAMVTGANRGLGLEGALAFAEAGARTVYCVENADAPSSDWSRVQEYVSRMRGPRGESRLEYIRGTLLTR